MAHYTTSLRSRWTPAEAFAYMADLRNFEEWDPGVSSSELVVGPQPGPAAEYDVRVTGTTLRYRTIEFDQPRRVVVEAESKLLHSVDVIEVTPSGTGSEIRYEATLELNGILRFADPLLRLAFDRIGDRAANGLRDVVPGPVDTAQPTR
ncbi:MAG: SRPBCC family protein [Acidimicrobiales bacterium]